MNIIDSLAKCRSIVYQGFTSANVSGIKWLNDLCIELKRCCELLKLILSTSNTTSDDKESMFRDECSLCCTQIIKCVRYMEKTIKAERLSSGVLSITRQHFLDRILWCLEKLSKSIEEGRISDKGTICKMFFSDPNFVDTMDYVVDLVSPMTMFNEATILGNLKIASNRAEIMIQSATIRSAVNDLLGLALSFANVIDSGDRKPLTTMCQSVLKECVAFEKLASFDESSKTDESQLQLRATGLENALYQLDGLINDNLLRLVFVVFAQMHTKPLVGLAESVECQDKGLDEQIVQFDEMTDRLHQIGTFAAAFSPSQQDKNTIRSALASAESLEPVLVPAILSSNTSPIHSEILCTHWTEEMTILRNTIQNIIDTNAFSASLYDHISLKITEMQRQYAPAAALGIISYANVFIDHLQCSWKELKLADTNSKRRLCFDNFELMLKECAASVDACSTTESQRVVKRFRILLNQLKKFMATLVDSTRQEDDINFTIGCVSLPESRRHNEFIISSLKMPANSLQALEVSLVPENTDEFFRSFGISKSIRKRVLYTPRDSCTQATTSRQKSALPRIQKKASLRSKLFKRYQPIASALESEITTGVNFDQTMDLQITNILEELTDLSTTLSNAI